MSEDSDSESNELVSSIRLNFDLKDPEKISTKIISIPPSILRPGRSYCITLSKINSWPINVYARIISTDPSIEEARKTISSLLSTEPFFSLSPSSDKKIFPSQSNNLFIKESVSVGLDVEKLYFSVQNTYLPSYYNKEEHYWMILGLKRVDQMTEVFSNHKYISNLYSDYSINLNIDTIYCGVPVSNFPLIALIAMVIIAYFSLIRKYHLRLFALK